MIVQRPISRKQLAAFLPDQESVLAVEKLFKLSGEQHPTSISELFVLNEEANALAESANARAALAEALARALEPLVEEASTRPPVVQPNPPPVNSYADIASTVTQAFAAADTPQAITFDSAPFAHGFSIGAPASRIVAGNAGLYAIRVTLQIASSSPSTQGMFIWARKNGADIPLSSSHVTVASNSSYILPNVSFVIPLLAGEYFEIMVAVTSTDVSLTANAAQAAPYTRPASPSAKLRITQVSA